jgi:hypothetical protein
MCKLPDAFLCDYFVEARERIAEIVEMEVARPEYGDWGESL